LVKSCRKNFLRKAIFVSAFFDNLLKHLEMMFNFLSAVRAEQQRVFWTLFQILDALKAYLELPTWLRKYVQWTINAKNTFKHVSHLAELQSIFHIFIFWIWIGTWLLKRVNKQLKNSLRLLLNAVNSPSNTLATITDVA